MSLRKRAPASFEVRQNQAIPAISAASASRAWGPVVPTGGGVLRRVDDWAVVATLTVTLLPGTAELGETVQVASEGAPVQEKFTFWLNPPSAATLKV